MSTTTKASDSAADELKVKLEPGEMKLFSSFIPSLDGGDYKVAINHTLELRGHQPKPLSTEREFRITAPRYALAPGDVYSSFPHPGYGEEAKVLPHVLLTDPHLPWARPVADGDKFKGHPWIGILSFAIEELQSKIADVLSTYSSLKDLKPSQTQAYSLKLKDLWSLNNQVVLPLDPKLMQQSDDNRPSGEKGTDIVEAVFLTYKLFEQLFCEIDGATKKPIISLKKFQYMSHVRMVNAAGTVSASTEGPGNVRYGVVVGPRSGPVRLTETITDLSKPIPIVAHLFSLERLLSLDVDLIKSKGYVGLISLHSWVYDCLPSKEENYAAALAMLGKSVQPLRLSTKDINGIVGKMVPEGAEEDVNCKWLRQRLDAGYSFISFRPSTGERTAGIFRGALVPQLSNISTLPKTSNVGSDLQIIDCVSGVPDLTYHLAWELGRGLGSSDSVFSAAMLRLRTRINNEAQDRARGGSSQDRKNILDRLRRKPDGKTNLVRDTNANQGRRGQNTLRRWNKRKVCLLDPEDEETDLKPDDEIVTEIKQVTANICQNIKLPGSAVGGGGTASGGGANTATDLDAQNSSSWAVIMQWIIDKLMLLNIPNVYLYPEPLALPEEAFRTFHIDEIWTNAFLDGALSVANHRFYTQIDYIRDQLKANINVELAKGKYQIPKWGFIIRSKVVLAFPDLRIQVPWPKAVKDPGEEVARMQRLAPDTLLCLFDRQPGDGFWSDKGQNEITIKEPPHQQKFSVGDYLGKNEIGFKYRFLPTATAPDSQKTAALRSTGKAQVYYYPEGKAKTDGGYDAPNIYNWETRCVNSAVLAETAHRASKTVLAQDLFNAPEPSSALTGIQLNDAPMTLSVNLLAKPTAGLSNQRSPRELPTLNYESVSAEVAKGHQHATAASLTTPFPRRGNFPFPRIRQSNPSPELKLRAAAREVVVTPLQQAAVASANLQTTYLEKAVFPLHNFGCNIPVDNPAAIDLVFSISAQSNVDRSIALKSLTVILPAGKNRTDLLRVTRKNASNLTVLPSARSIGKGNRWLAGGRECDGLAKEFTRITTQDNAPAPTTTLAVRVVPRGKLCPLSDMPNLSFILSGVELNDMVSADVKIIFQEEYSVRVKGGEEMQLAWEKTETIVTYLKVEKQRGI
ncbi:hypothetical protein TWF481_000794 [Arthrobotrys musiformis]|uniref:Uncharacterized protein n=1 Tax=Arthrobotrys musiformis TaxID=47236 RepID=A0AAV9WNL5_9PEZI